VTSADIDSGITDGSPAGENKDEVINVILRTDQELRRSRYGPDTVSYRESESSRSRVQAFQHCALMLPLPTAPYLGTTVFAPSALSEGPERRLEFEHWRGARSRRTSLGVLELLLTPRRVRTGRQRPESDQVPRGAG
jgi:hypothetical protein